MRAGRKRFIASVVLSASLLLSSVATAQNATAPAGDWSALKSVAAGSRLAVKLKSGKTVEGGLRDVSDAALSLTVGGRQTDIKPEEVQRVYRVGGTSAKKAALVGLAVGAGAGAAIGAAGGDDNGFVPGRGVFAAGFAVLGGGAGALIGYAVGRGRRKRVLIYDAGHP
jgi:hypothetical protein